MAVYRIAKEASAEWEYAWYEGDVQPIEYRGAPLRNGTEGRDISTGARYIFYNGVWEEDLTLIYAISEGIKQQ